MHCQEMFIFILSIFLVINVIKSDSSGPNILKSLPSEDSSNIVTSYRNDPLLQSNETTVIIEKASSDYCQIVIYFEYFHLGEVDQQGYCTGGLTVSGHNNSNNVPKICGENGGQHMYLNFYGNDPIYLNFEETSDLDDWYMNVTQIRCLDILKRAPPQCLQFQTDTFSSVKSFNYQSITSIADPPVTYQLANQSYYICLGQPEEYYYFIEWTRGDQTTNYYFVVSSDIETVDPGIVGTISAASFQYDCTGTGTSNDYVEIITGEFSETDGLSLYSQLFCGAGFPQYVKSYTSPYYLHVVTSAEEGTREGSIGFNLEYRLYK